MSAIPVGLCQCGCGGQTKVHRGRQNRFIYGHGGRGSLNPSWKGGKAGDSYGYILQHAPERATSQHCNYVREHVLVAEKALGRQLPAGAVVHHVNGIRDDNRPQNLVICQDQAYHALLHVRARALAACGHAGWRQCEICREYDDPARMSAAPRRNKPNWSDRVYHMECSRNRTRAYVVRRRLAGQG